MRDGLMGALKPPRALVLPLFSDGYAPEPMRAHIERLAGILGALGIDAETAEPIGTVAQAEACALRYHPGAYDFAVLFPATWAPPTLAVYAARFLLDRPVLVWSVSEFTLNAARTEMSSAPAAAALMGVLQERGTRCGFVSDFPDRAAPDERTAERIRSFAVAARALEGLHHTRIGCFGAYFNGISSAALDPGVLRHRFGVELFTPDVSELLARMAAIDVDSERFGRWRREAASRLARLPDRKLGEIGRMTLALEDYIQEYDLRALSVRCHTELSQGYGVTACLPLALLADRCVCSCEADWPVTLTQVLLNDLSGGGVSTYVDLRTFDADGMSCGACGYAPCGMGEGGVGCPGPSGDPLDLAGDGYVTNVQPFREGRVTLARLVKGPGGALAMHLTGGFARREGRLLREYGCPAYPMVRIEPDVPVERFVRRLGGNHYALVYADVRDAMARFCEFAGLPVVE